MDMGREGSAVLEWSSKMAKVSCQSPDSDRTMLNCQAVPVCMIKALRCQYDINSQQQRSYICRKVDGVIISDCLNLEGL